MGYQPPPTSTSETRIEQFARLESIFLPESWARRNVMYPDERPARFVHYTSADAALNIIRAKRLWMRSTTCMADYREVQHGFDMLNSFFSEKGSKDLFAAMLNDCAPNISDEAIGIFNQWWSDIQWGTFIASVSEHDVSEDIHGRLSMWRAFGGGAARVALVVNVPAVTDASDALKLSFNPVVYSSAEDVRKEMFTVINNVQANSDYLRSVERPILLQWLVNMLMTGVTCLKHEGFREEREWRLLYSPKIAPSPLIEQVVESIAGVPQTICKLPLDSTVSPALSDLDFSRTFERLIIGPSPYPWAMYQAFVQTLKAVGVHDAEGRVYTSGIPIRA